MRRKRAVREGSIRGGLVAALVAVFPVAPGATAEGERQLPVMETSGPSTPRIAKAPKRLALGGRAHATLTLAGKTTRQTPVTVLLRADDAARPKVIGRSQSGSTTRRRIRLRAPDDVADGNWQLVACVGRRCSAPTRIRLFSDSPFDRIDRANTLGQAQTLIYKLQAMLGDRRLPKRFRGPTPVPSDNTLLQDAYGALHMMSPAQRRLVGPYFVPPRFRESFWAPKSRKAARAAQETDLDVGELGCEALATIREGAWRGIKTPHAVVWYHPGDELSRAKARLVARWIPDIWRKLVGAFKPPKPDNETGCDPTGDGRFDIYVVTRLPAGRGTDAFTAPLGKGSNCDAKSAWMMVRAASPPRDVAHEFMHAIQLGYPGTMAPGLLTRRDLPGDEVDHRGHGHLGRDAGLPRRQGASQLGPGHPPPVLRAVWASQSV